MARIRKFHLPGCSGGDCECLWELDYRPLGMYGPRRRVRFPTKKAAEKFQAETALQAARGEYVEPAKVPTFAEVAEDWFQSKTDRRPSHVSDLRTRLDKHILPVFAMHKLDRISVAAVEKFRNDLRDREYAYRTINTILRIMGAHLSTRDQAWPVQPESSSTALNAPRQQLGRSKRMTSGLSIPAMIRSIKTAF